MNESQHVSSQFDEELSRLRTHVLQMGGLVETQISSAIEAYTTGEVASVKTIVDTDRKVNDLEKAIDDDCAHVIAKRKKIAKGVRRIYEAGHMPSQYGIGIRHLAEAALTMVRQALDAFARLDGELAKAVISADNDVDVEFKSIIRQLITHMMEDPRTITTSIDIIWIARAIERIGDHAKNVSEQVIFIVEGRDIRHTKEKAAQ